MSDLFARSYQIWYTEDKLVHAHAIKGYVDMDTYLNTVINIAIEVRDQHHAPASLLPGKIASIAHKQETR